MKIFHKLRNNEKNRKQFSNQSEFIRKLGQEADSNLLSKNRKKRRMSTSENNLIKLLIKFACEKILFTKNTVRIFYIFRSEQVEFEKNKFRLGGIKSKI